MSQDITGSADKLTEKDRREARILGDAIFEIVQLTIRGYTARIPGLSRSIRYYTEEIMALGNIINSRFIQRIHEEEKPRSGSTLYTDVFYAEEQLIDYCDMIAEALLRYEKESGENGEIKTGSKEMTRRQIHEIFRDKFEALEEAS